MKLGIDCKWYFSGPPSGQVVVKNLIDEVIKQADESIIVYLFIYARDVEKAKDEFSSCVKIISVPNLPNFIVNMFYIKAIAEHEQVDIVLFQNFGSLFKGSYRSLIYIHDVLFLDFPQYYSKKELFYFKLMPLLARKADRIITISNSEKNRLLTHINLSPSKIDVIYHGIDKKFTTLSKYVKSDLDKVKNLYALPDRYILYVGRINIRKNLQNLVKAFSLVEDKKISLVIVGRVDSKNTPIVKLIEELDLAGRIVITGYVNDIDLYKIYACATIFCFPSFAEGFGLPPLEAMSCGVPVVVSNRTCLPEVCDDAATFIDPSDTNDIAKAIDSLLFDSLLYKKFVSKGINHASKFTWTEAAFSLIQIVKSVY